MERDERDSWVSFWVGITFIIACLALFAVTGSGCDGGIPLDVPPADICDADYDEDCELGDYVTCLPRERYLLQLRNARDYGFQQGVDSVEHNECPGRSEGRGRSHA